VNAGPQAGPLLRLDRLVMQFGGVTALNQVDLEKYRA